MQETRNNCFGSKKRSTTLLQAKTVKHECRNATVVALYVAVAFRHSCLTVFAWRRVVLRFPTRKNCCEFLASDTVIFQSVIKPGHMITRGKSRNKSLNFWTASICFWYFWIKVKKKNNKSFFLKTVSKTFFCSQVILFSILPWNFHCSFNGIL